MLISLWESSWVTIFFFSLDLEFSLCLCFWTVYSVRLGEGCFELKFWGYLLAS